MKKSGKIITLLFAIILVFCVGAIASSAATSGSFPADSGRTFTSKDELSMTNPLTVQPKTFKALINVPSDTSAKGVIFGNCRENDISFLNFEITSVGKPSLYFNCYNSSTEKYVATRITFDYDIRGLGWIDLAITHTTTDSGSEFVCYVNGEVVATETSDQTLAISLASCQRQYRFALGHDWYSVNNYFKGEIQDVAIYNSVLTGEEIFNIYENGVDLDTASLMAYYDLTLPENQTGTRITDSTANAHDFEPLWQDTRRDFDYDYSIAVVGDTQHLVYDDAHKGTAWMSAIYDWLVENKDEKNIKFVMGVGDITHRDGKDDVSDGVDKTNVEWDIAVEQLNKLYDAGIEYSLIVGNHDSTSQLNKFFADNPNFTEADIGYYSGNSLGNYYMKFTANENNKYIVLCLDYGANDDKLNWARGIIEANPDYKVIITTHAYMSANGTTLEGHESTSVPRPSTNANADQKLLNNGDDMWIELASKYENIVLVFSGHISASDIVYRKDYGDNGNTVYQMLMDFQAMDAKYSRTTGMIAMLYFNAEGDVAYVEYVSAYRSLAAKAENPAAKDIVFRPAVNSFMIDYPEEKATGEETKYGTIPPTYLDAELYPIVVFKKDGSFVTGSYSLNRAMENIVSVYNDQNDSYVMLMRRNSTTKGAAVSYGKFNGEILIDLGGYTLTAAENYMMLATFSGNTGKHPAITIQNGTIIKDAENIGLLNFGYGSSLSRDAYCDVTFNNVTFRSLVINNKNTSTIFITFEDGNATAAVRVNAVFNDCTFDIANSISSSIMLTLKHYWSGNQNDRVVYNVTVNGGSVLANTASDFTNRFALLNNNDNGRADTVTYGTNADGEYLKLVLPTGVAAPTNNYTLVGGAEAQFKKTTDTETNSIYTLNDVSRLATKYGAVTEEYADPNEYPVALFKKTSSGYTFIGAYKTFTEAAGNSESKDANSTGLRKVSGWYSKTDSYSFVFLLRSDAKSTGLSNWNSARGNYTVDLNGYTLTHSSTNPMIRVNHSTTDASYNPAGTYACFSLSFINGTLRNTSTGAFFMMNYGKNNTRSYSVSYTFDNVTFESTNSINPIFENWEEGGSAANSSTNETLKTSFHVYVTATFNDCIFDYTENIKSAVMIYMKGIKNGAANSYDRTQYTVTVNGGTILTNKAFDITQFYNANADTNGRADTITFGKGVNGNYLTLVLPNGIAAPSSTDVYTNASGAECIFAKAYDTADGVVYRLRPTATVGIEFSPKMNLSLDRNLVMNVYVPAEILVKFTFGGTEYADLENTDLETTVIDGKVYFVLKVSLPASEAAQDVKLVATVTAGETTATATFTFSVIKYAEKMIASEKAAEVQLAKDILSYVRAAYVYFESEDTAAISKINAILGEGYDKNNMPTANGNGTVVTEGIKAATFVLDGEASMRFYLADGYDASRYAFYINGYKVATETGSDSTGAYVDIDVYAYSLCQTVTYTIDGVESGSYNIEAYYNYVMNEYGEADKEALISVTERFWKYLQSAAAYRNSVIAG